MILLGIFLTIGAFIAGHKIYKIKPTTIFSPFVIALGIIIILILLTPLTYEQYAIGGAVIDFFLAPLTVVFAVPIYRNREIIKKYMPIVLGMIIIAIVINFIVIMSITYIFTDEILIMASLSLKSVTTPIALAIGEQLTVNTAIVIITILITGIIGSITCGIIIKALNIKSKMAIGLSIGAISHAIGTSRAMEMGELEGAMSSLSMALTGVLASLIIPILILFL